MAALVQRLVFLAAASHTLVAVVAESSPQRQEVQVALAEAVLVGEKA